MCLVLLEDPSADVIIQTLSIKYDDLVYQKNELFPYKFDAEIITSEKNFSKKFVQITKDNSYPIGVADIYTNDQTGKVYKVDHSNEEVYKLKN